MTRLNMLRLLLLAAIWGASFLFTRIAAPWFAPNVLILARVGLAALMLGAGAWWLRRSIDWRRDGKHFLVLGTLNSALPFVLFAFAAKTLSASMLSILNATTPLWGALVLAMHQRTPPPARTIVGMVLGLCGVALLVGNDRLVASTDGAWAVAASLAAALSYGVSSVYAKRTSARDPYATAFGTMAGASVVLLPTLAWSHAPVSSDPWVLGAVAALGIVCSGVAYLLYFRILAEEGPTPALTVTYLIPLFGVVWGVIFLGETVGWHTLAGSAVIMAGTALVLRPNARRQA